MRKKELVSTVNVAEFLLTADGFYQFNGEHAPREIDAEGRILRRCLKCELYKPHTDFTPKIRLREFGSVTVHDLTARCKPCMNERAKDWYHNRFEEMDLPKKRKPWKPPEFNGLLPVGEMNKLWRY